ncbi:MAG: hypothetical protein KDC98_08425 [Planctomycetes bacterium]|nr:hypothetical protein [Planctomycetota bacterium]
MAKLRFHDFNGQKDPLVALGRRDQAVYLRHYLADLGATTVLEEPAYFDRDYLSEFAAFYGVSSRGYSNRCRRCHFFSTKVSRDRIRSAAGGSKAAIAYLQQAYLGFVVIRPIPSAPLGRTVVRWYPDLAKTPPRVTNPAREYRCHVAGIPLRVYGLAWQQQDAAVGACATVALWSMLHSSAFDDHHAIPTTADITRFAHRNASLGSRVFPSSGLTIYQLCEAIKEAGLAPVVLQGDTGKNGRAAFTRDRFAAACASLIRSGYPALIIGELENSGAHAVCAVGFRECAPPVPQVGTVQLQDGGVQHIYLHDDNLGPSVRFAVGQDPTDGYVRLEASAPPPRHTLHLPADPSASYPAIIPSQIVTAVHEDLRTSPDGLHRRAILAAKILVDAYNGLIAAGALSGNAIGMTVSTRFTKLHRYLGEELARTLRGSKDRLARVRLALCEQTPPMSLHVGIVRIGWQAAPLLDVLFDTTDSDSNLTPFCNVQYHQDIGRLATALTAAGYADLGEPVEAF